MTGEEIQALLGAQRTFFNSGATLSVDFRIKSLRRLYDAVKAHEDDIHAALTADLGKSAYEGFMCESGLALTEISYMIKHTRKLARRKTVRTPLAQFASHSFTQAMPYGNTLVMSPWNYPFLLTIDPLADAIAAGNTVILKPSAYSPGDQRDYRAHCRGMLRARARGSCHGRPCGKHRAARAEIRLHLLHGKPERGQGSAAPRRRIPHACRA